MNKRIYYGPYVDTDRPPTDRRVTYTFIGTAPAPVEVYSRWAPRLGLAEIKSRREKLNEERRKESQRKEEEEKIRREKEVHFEGKVQTAPKKGEIYKKSEKLDRKAKEYLAKLYDLVRSLFLQLIILFLFLFIIKSMFT